MITVILLLGKTIGSVVNFLLHVIAYVMLFLGLYVPLIYLMYGLIIAGIFKFDLFSLSGLYSSLYVWGLALSFVVSLIISVRNIFLKPATKIVEKLSIKPPKKAPKKEIYGQNRDFEGYPLIYESQVHKGIIVHEYKYYFDLFERVNGRLQKIKTVYKNSGK